MRAVVRWCKISGTNFLCKYYQSHLVISHDGTLIVSEVLFAARAVAKRTFVSNMILRN
jgi:hypothetical protein